MLSILRIISKFKMLILRYSKSRKRKRPGKPNRAKEARVQVRRIRIRRKKRKSMRRKSKTLRRPSRPKDLLRSVTRDALPERTPRFRAQIKIKNTFKFNKLS